MKSTVWLKLSCFTILAAIALLFCPFNHAWAFLTMFLGVLFWVIGVFIVGTTEETEQEKKNPRIQKALEYAVRYGGIDGDHHKTWVIDQMVRALTGCPLVNGTATEVNGKCYEYTKQGESEEYKKLVKEAKAGEDGPETYSWETGIAP